ncbi:hypothetical protein HKD37_13G036076 [Glycine soja]|nr:hypothetical protein GmHk_13G037397 [Glycine max]
MAKTRGGKVARHRQRANAQAHVVNDHEEPQEVLVNAYANSQALGSFPGGPEDFSVLRHFSNHVATRLWNKEDRGALKVVKNSGLAPLLDCSYQMVDKDLLSAFAEWWQ